MSGTTEVNFSSFTSKLSPCALSCFNRLLDTVRERILREGPQPIYEASLAAMIETCGAEDAEAVAQSIRDILQCRVEMKKDEYLYFFTFFTSVAIEKGVIRYSLPREINEALSAVGSSSSI
ncbi:MAG TPA: hypothetical protein PK036_14170 [Geobacteraceae bacterium]|nr:hypothetical protein [Geobacteraceae bacterium]